MLGEPIESEQQAMLVEPEHNHSEHWPDAGWQAMGLIGAALVTAVFAYLGVRYKIKHSRRKKFQD